MASVNQDIRYAESDGKNNPYALYSYVKPSKSISGVGAPDADLGENEWLYMDTSTGFQYKKENGIWDPFVNFSAFAPPAIIPDPLEVDELHTDLIKGRNAESITLDGGVGGDINMTLGIGASVSINGGNTLLTGNGNIQAGSLIQGYQLGADNLAGSSMYLNPGTDEISLIGPSKTIRHNTPASTLTLRTNAADVVVNPVGGGNLVTTSNISHQPPAGENFEISTTGANSDVFIHSNLAGAGNLTLQSGASGSIVHNTLATFNTFGLSTSAINNSDTYNEAKALTADHTGALVWSELPETVVFTAINVGANGTKYLDPFGLAVNPADVGVYPVFASNMLIRRVEAVIMSNAAWLWGGGTAIIEFGSIATGSPCTDANFVPLFNVAMGTGGEFYFLLAKPNVSLGAGKKLAARIVATGTASTNSTAEFMVKLTLSQ